MEPMDACKRLRACMDEEELPMPLNDHCDFDTCSGTVLSGGAVLVGAVKVAGQTEDAQELLKKSVAYVGGAPRDCVYRMSILGEERCSSVISEAENYASTVGWTSRRHKRYPTVDLPVSLVPGLDFVFPFLQRSILPTISALFDVSLSGLSLADVFIVKYDASAANGQTALQLHEDGYPFSFNILLSKDDDFVGGGTYFEVFDETVKPRQGECLIHHGRTRHAGMQIIQGQRYVLVGFVESRDSSALAEFGSMDDTRSISPSQR